MWIDVIPVPLADRAADSQDGAACGLVMTSRPPSGSLVPGGCSLPAAGFSPFATAHCDSPATLASAVTVNGARSQGAGKASTVAGKTMAPAQQW